MFSRQFIVARAMVSAPPGWKAREWAGLVVQYAPDLPIVDFRTDVASGLLLGWPVLRAKLYKDGEALFFTSSSGPPLFRELSGRFLALSTDDDGPACYLDACGLLPAVFSKERNILAATTSLIPAIEDEPNIADLRAAFRIPEKSNWYPFGLTGAAGIRRLLPNHRLDLSDFSVRRVWPKAWPVPVSRREIPACVTEIASRLEQNVAAMAAEGSTVCNLTAGRDTRMVLAALRPFAKELRVTTFRMPDQIGDQDCIAARAIAARHGLQHLEITYDKPVQTDIDEWLVNTGYSVGGRTAHLATTSKRIAGLARFNLTGLGGEIGRGFPWPREGDFGDHSVSVTDLLARIHFKGPVLPIVEEAGRAWLAGLPPGSVPALFKVAFMELSLASGAGPSFYGHCHGGISITPFNDRRMIEQMLILPQDYRFREQLTLDVVDRLWPELNLFPFNQLTARPRQLREQQRKILAMRLRLLGRRIGSAMRIPAAERKLRRAHPLG